MAGIPNLNTVLSGLPSIIYVVQGASFSHTSTLLFKWAITLKGVDTNFPLQISSDFHNRYLWALSTTLPAKQSSSIAELSFITPPFSLCLYCWCCSSATRGIRDLTLWGRVKPLSCWWGGSAVCATASMRTSFGSGYEHTTETSKMLSEWSPSAAVESSVWWPCDLFVQPQWPFLLAEEESENGGGGRKGGRADRFTPSLLLASPMSHLILLLTAKSTPLINC